ncbi:hypothetical protein [Undibacterium parvum]|uniref:hypothetical protein n=1 Tax=Undibacterium parvum TaxID=401471 RepID=UPI0013002EE6|nr:hypothetical protein [Undibacterium parvum]
MQKHDLATANQKQHAAKAHIPCGFQASVLGEAHGIWAVALPVEIPCGAIDEVDYALPS